MEQLVASLERVLAGGPGVAIEAPGWRLDKRSTGPRRKRREFDVLLTFQSAHHTHLTAIEVKDLARPVDAPVVEALHSKLQGTGVHRGVIVSGAGFSELAREVASAHEIVCMDFGAVEGFGWFPSLSFIGVTLVPKTASFFLGLDSDADRAPALPVDVTRVEVIRDGTAESFPVIGMEIWNQHWRKLLNAAGGHDEGVGFETTTAVRFDPPVLFRLPDEPTTTSVSHGVMQFTYDALVREDVATARRYAKAEGGYIADIAYTAPIQIGSAHLRMTAIMASDAPGIIQLSALPASSEESRR